jgi:hypothetical protein
MAGHSEVGKEEKVISVAASVSHKSGLPMAPRSMTASNASRSRQSLNGKVYQRNNNAFFGCTGRNSEMNSS